MCASEYVVDNFSGFDSGIENLFGLKNWAWRPRLWPEGRRKARMNMPLRVDKPTGRTCSLHPTIFSSTLSYSSVPIVTSFLQCPFYSTLPSPVVLYYSAYTSLYGDSCTCNGDKRSVHRRACAASPGKASSLYGVQCWWAVSNSLLTQQISKKRRAPAPILSPQHLALAQSLPHSKAGTPTPSLLTPPVTGTPAMSPPPRHEADDYMTVHAPDHHLHQKKHSKKRTRKLYNTREGSEGSRPPQRSPRSGMRTASSYKSNCELCAAGICDGDEDTNLNTPLIKSTGRQHLQTRLHGSQNITEVDKAYVQTWSTLSSSVVADEPDSPAVNALRSLSFQVRKPSNSQGLRRVSTAFANTLNLFRPDPTVSFATVPSHKASKKAEEASRKSSAHSKSLAHWDTNRRRPTFEDDKDVSRTLGTPATITLRKASNVYATSPITTSMSASLTCEREHKRAADAPASELLAFYLSPLLENEPTVTDLPSPESAETPKSLKEQPAFTLEVEPGFTRRGSKFVSQSSGISNTQRCSMPAEAALTFADVHVAQGSFAVGPKSRKQSLIATEFSRRISTVQFWSRNSVHEVIWREDEPTSGSSLTASSTASQHVGHSFRSTPSSESEEMPVQEPAIKPKEIKIALPVISDSVSMLTRIPDNLSRWTWEASSASAEGAPCAVDHKSDPLSQMAEARAREAETKRDPQGRVLVISTSDPGFASLPQSSDQQSSRSHKPSFSELPSVQFFPSLRPRSSTAEWRRAPLVDLNDPLAGRMDQYQAQRSTYSAGLDRSVGGSIAGGQERRSSQLHDTAGGRRWSSSPLANARLGSIGSVGSCVGVSSRKRVSRHQVPT